MLYIKVENDQIIGHPVTLENLQLIYQPFDISNPPDNYLPFNRGSYPVTSSPYEVHEAKYVLSSNVVNEIYETRQMTDDEKQKLWDQELYNKPYSSWILDKNTCIWCPPVPYPEDGNKYYWNEDDLNWKLVTAVDSNK